jgi:hypothetical protein
MVNKFWFHFLDTWKSFGTNNQAKVVPLHRLSTLAMTVMVTSCGASKGVRVSWKWTKVDELGDVY